MKPYLVFIVRKAYDADTRSGGWYEYHDSFNSAHEARAACGKHYQYNPGMIFEIIDTIRMKTLELN